MPHRSEPRLLVLHGLRLKGAAEVAALAAAVALPVDDVRRELDDLAARGLAVEHRGLLPGWSLTAAGREVHARALQRELELTGARPAVETGYHQFRRLNSGVLDACSRWQVRPVRGKVVRNDHHDAAWDARVLADLDAALGGVRPVGDRLAAELARFAPYPHQLADALGRARAGDDRYVTKPMIPSFHTVWFEMHEDLLVTLGLDRTAEASGTGGVN